MAKGVSFRRDCLLVELDTVRRVKVQKPDQDPVSVTA